MSIANNQSPRSVVLVSQIITLALFAGPFVFLLYVLFGMDGLPPQEGIQSYMAAGMAGMNFFLQFLIRMRPNPTSLPESHRNEQFDPRADEVFVALAGTYQVELIIKVALLEGAAFYNIIAYRVEQQPWTLAIIAALLVFILMQFPTRSRIRNRIETETMDWFK